MLRTDAESTTVASALLSSPLSSPLPLSLPLPSLLRLLSALWLLLDREDIARRDATLLTS
jgi:hypothetical protein